MALTIHPYANPLNLADRTGIALFSQGSAELDTEFDGKTSNVTTFIAELQARAKKCCWRIMNIEWTDAAGNAHIASILTDHGTIPDSAINDLHTAFTNYDDGTTAIPDVGLNSGRDHRAAVKMCIDRKMLHQCIEKSLSEKYKKSIAVKIPEFKEDGILFLHWILKECHMTSTLATRDHKLEYANLRLAKCGNNVAQLHLKFDTKLFNLKQAGKTIEEDDQIMYHFEAYKSYQNQQFQLYVMNLEGQWSAGTITTVKELRDKITAHVQDMIRNKQWNKTPATTEFQATALPAEEGSDSKKGKGRGGRKPKSTTSDASAAEKLKERNAKWKFEKNGNSNTTVKNDKTYQWCTGPGHFGVHMWVRHEPGCCNNDRASSGTQAQANVTETSGGRGGSKKKMSKSKFRAMVTEELQGANSFNDDLSGLIDSIVAKAYD